MCRPYKATEPQGYLQYHLPADCFLRKAISIRGGATTVLFKVCKRNTFCLLHPVTRIPSRRACASPRLEQLPTSKYFFCLGDQASTSTDFTFRSAKVAGAAFQCSYRNIHGTEQIYGVLPQLIIPHGRFFRLTDNDHFLLLELMDTVNASFFNAVCAFFLTEARAIACQGLRQVFCFIQRINEFTNHGMFGWYQSDTGLRLRFYTSLHPFPQSS